MANIHCSCGESFSDGEIPCPHEFVLIADSSIEKLTTNLLHTAGKKGDTEALLSHLIMTAGFVVFKCPRCQSLLVFWEGLEKPALVYKKEVYRPPVREK